MLASALDFCWSKSRVSEPTSHQASCTTIWADSTGRPEISPLSHLSHTRMCIQVCCLSVCVRLTHNLKGDGGFVFKAVHFNGNLVNTRVRPLSGPNKQNAVPVTVPDADSLCIHRLTVLQPGHRRFGLSLRSWKKDRQDCKVFCANSTCYLWSIQMVCVCAGLQGRGWPGWSALQPV